MAYLAIDLGTTGCRSILFDSNLRQISDCYQEYGILTPKNNWVEQDANLWWDLTLETAKEAIQKSGIPPKEIKSISVSSQGITLVPVDENFTPLCNALSWLDKRAEKQTSQLEKDFGLREMFSLTGKPIDASYFLPKLLWLKEECSEIYNQAWKFLMPLDFLLGKLTGKCFTDHSMASGTLMYDIKNNVWSREILQKYEIPENKLPELRWSGERAGTLLPAVSKELGLDGNCVVAIGAQDQKCAALGMGLREDVITISLGTSGAISKYWTEAKTDGSTSIPWSAYINKGSWTTEGAINTAGACLRWLRDTMFPGENYDAINKEAEKALKKEDSLLFYPYLGGPSCPDYYADSEGCFYGVNLATQRGDFALAVMEGIAFQIRIILEEMRVPSDVHKIVLFGGGAKSPLWCQIIADVTGMNIEVPETLEAAGAGAAILAGIASGDFRRDQTPKIHSRGHYSPGDKQDSYNRKYIRYRHIEKKLWQ